jgi:hypothetical protein
MGIIQKCREIDAIPCGIAFRVSIYKQAEPLVGTKGKGRLKGQKNRTQKNESCIFLRSIFLPYQDFTSALTVLQRNIVAFFSPISFATECDKLLRSSSSILEFFSDLCRTIFLKILTLKAMFRS